MPTFYTAFALASTFSQTEWKRNIGATINAIVFVEESLGERSIRAASLPPSQEWGELQSRCPEFLKHKMPDDATFLCKLLSFKLGEKRCVVKGNAMEIGTPFRSC